MESENDQLPPLDEILGKLPWFDNLTASHRREIMDEVSSCLATGTSRDQYMLLLERWADVAHGDVKLDRFREWRENSFEVPYQRLDSSDPYNP